jgi:hypothetical protein
MSGNAKQIFHGISRKIFAKLRKKASRLGISVASPQGEAEKDGVKIHWNYDASEQLLEVETKAPFWIDANPVNRALRQEIEVTLRASRAA